VQSRWRWPPNRAARHGRAIGPHRILGLCTLGQLNLGYFPLYVIRTVWGTHQGAPRAVGVTERWRAMVTDLSWSSAASVASSEGWKQSGSGQKGVVQHPQARRGVVEVQNTVARWCGEQGKKLGFDLNLCEIRARGDSIYMAF
jgi:hypothetical protein